MANLVKCKTVLGYTVVNYAMPHDAYAAQLGCTTGRSWDSLSAVSHYIVLEAVLL